MKYPTIVFAVCSRGMILTDTVEWLLRAQQRFGAYAHFEFTKNQSIPEAQNVVTEQALAHNPGGVFYIEEDMLPPEPGVLIDTMVSEMDSYPVQVIDYPLRGGTRSVRRDDKGNVLFSGMGCMLVRADVFPVLDKPWFASTAYTIEQDYGVGRLQLKKGTLSYGGQDIYTSQNLRKHGFTIHVVEGRCRHFMIKEYGQQGVNNGCHLIEELK